MTVTVAKMDSTGYGLEVIATGVNRTVDLATVLRSKTNPWALFENFVVFSESDPRSHPDLYRVIPGEGKVHRLGPAIQDPSVNRIWNGLIAAADLDDACLDEFK